MPTFIDEYSQLFDYIYRYLAVRVYDRDVVADLASDIFVIAWSKQHTYDPDKGSWRQWLTGIAKYRLLNYWRSHQTTVSLDDIEHELAMSSMPNYGQVDFNQLLERLPETTRQLLIWRYVDDLTYQEIAKLIKKKPPAVRKFFSRLHQQLQTYYELT